MNFTLLGCKLLLFCVTEFNSVLLLPRALLIIIRMSSIGKVIFYPCLSKMEVLGMVRLVLGLTFHFLFNYYFFPCSSPLGLHVKISTCDVRKIVFPMFPYHAALLLLFTQKFRCFHYIILVNISFIWGWIIRRNVNG